jgi:hypothetical protein
MLGSKDNFIMLDLILVAAAVAFFVAGWGFVKGCDRL